MKLFESKIAKSKLAEAVEQRHMDVVNPELVEFFGGKKEFDSFMKNIASESNFIRKTAKANPVKAFINAKFRDHNSESSINESKAMLRKIAEISPLDATQLSKNWGISFTSNL